MLLSAVDAGHKLLGMSATAAKDPTEMRALGAMLGLHNGSHSAWTDFCIRYGCRMGNYGLKFDQSRKRDLEKLHRQIFPTKGNRIRVADIAAFPETQIVAEALDTGSTEFINRAYDEMERNLMKLESSDVSGSEKSAAGLAEMMKARKLAEEGKLALFADLAHEAIEEGRSVAIFLNFRDHIEKLSEQLKTDCIVWGGQKPEVRQQNIDNFNADTRRIIIVSLQAGGAGLSLHDTIGNHPRLAIVSPSFSCIDLKQALGRVHRAGAKTKSFQRIIFAAGVEIEEQICDSVRDKLQNLDTINDGDLAPKSILAHVGKAE